MHRRVISSLEEAALLTSFLADASVSSKSATSCASLKSEPHDPGTPLDTGTSACVPSSLY